MWPYILLNWYFASEFYLKVWAIADSKRQGFLGLNEFITAMQVFYMILFDDMHSYWQKHRLNLPYYLLFELDSLFH